MPETTLLIKSDPVQRLSISTVVEMGLKQHLAAINTNPVTTLCPLLNDDYIINDELCPECYWFSLTYLYEKLVFMINSGSIYRHIFLLDPWVALLRTSNVRLITKAEWLYVSTEFPVGTCDDSDYWNQFEDWLGKQDLKIIPSLTFVPAMDDGGIKPSSKDDLLSYLSWARKIVLYDEGENAQPDLSALSRSLKSAQPGDAFLLISPFIELYASQRPSLRSECALALRPRDLSFDVYSTLLSVAHTYISAVRPPPYSSKPASATAAIQEAHSSEVPKSLPLFWSQLGKVSPKNSTRKIAIVTCCYKYLQRLKIFLDSIARQTINPEMIELCVAVPGNPDGTVEYLDLFRIAHPKITVRTVSVSEDIYKNRGKMINAAASVADASIVMIADCDIVLPRYFLERIISVFNAKHVFGCFRTPLSRELTAHIVTGNLDVIEHFEDLKTQWDDAEKRELREGVLGYCQIVSREAFKKVMYPDEFDMINQSDIVFVERLIAQLGITPKLIDDLFVLHLAHPRDWSGTKTYL
ncbi:MAG TPA: glycosyltransferase family A protein [Candidatus Paceibacterota bacterium]|nr:glycosyltransferase family A protein [Candidatus Paceibacterota bacterium]